MLKYLLKHVKILTRKNRQWLEKTNLFSPVFLLNSFRNSGSVFRLGPLYQERNGDIYLKRILADPKKVNISGHLELAIFRSLARSPP